MKTSSRLFMICGLLMASSAYSATTGLAPDAGTISYTTGDTVDFQPFELSDFVNPDSGTPYLPNEPVKLQLGGTVKVYSTGLAFLQAVNETEKAMNRLGKSLRGNGISIIAKTVQNPTLILNQIGATLGMAPDKLWAKWKDEIADCQFVKVEDFDLDANVTMADGAQRKVSFKDHKPMLVRDFVSKVNQQERFLCKLGYSYVDKTLLGTQHLVESMLSQRQSIMDDLGISPYHPVFDFNYLADIKDIDTLVADVKAIVSTLNNPTPARLYDLARQVTSPLPPELQLPDIPTVPAPIVKKRPGLNLKKKKTWDIFDQGDQSTLNVYANAWMEINGTETKEEIRAQGTVGMYVIKRQINALDVDGYMYAGQDGVEGNFHAQVLDQDVYTVSIAKQLSYSWGEDKAINCVIGKDTSADHNCPFEVPFPTEYTQEFVIGVVPRFCHGRRHGRGRARLLCRLDLALSGRGRQTLRRFNGLRHCCGWL